VRGPAECFSSDLQSSRGRSCRDDGEKRGCQYGPASKRRNPQLTVYEKVKRGAQKEVVENIAERGSLCRSYQGPRVRGNLRDRTLKSSSGRVGKVNGNRAAKRRYFPGQKRRGRSSVVEAEARRRESERRVAERLESAGGTFNYTKKSHKVTLRSGRRAKVEVGTPRVKKGSLYGHRKNARG